MFIIQHGFSIVHFIFYSLALSVQIMLKMDRVDYAK